MKKLTALLLALVMAFSLVACGAGKSGTPTVAPTTGSDNADNETVSGNVTSFQKPANEMGVTLVVNTNLGDHAICDLSNAGLQEAAAKYGFTPKTIELGGDVTLQVPTMQELAEDPKCDIIVAGTGNLKEAVQQVAQEYPEQMFILYDAKDDLGLPNVFSMDHAQNEGAYLAGVAAALLTVSDAELANY